MLKHLLEIRKERDKLKGQDRISKADMLQELDMFFHCWEGDKYMFREVFETLRPGEGVTVADFKVQPFPSALIEHYQKVALEAVEMVEDWGKYDHEHIEERSLQIDQEEKRIEGELSWRAEGGSEFWPAGRVGVTVDGQAFDMWSSGQIRLAQWSLENWAADVLSPPAKKEEVRHAIV